MVKAVRFFLALAAVLPLVLNVAAKELADYQLGDRAEEDIVATSALTVVDPAGTEALKREKATHVPIVVRYDTNVAEEVEAQFRQIFSQTHDEFLNSVNKDFGHRKLSSQEMASFKFQSLAILFAKQNNFPLSTNRAALWASGDADQAYEEFLASAFREGMAHPIRPWPLPEGIKIGNTVRLLSVGGTNETFTLQAAERQSKGFSRTNFVPIVEIKKKFRALFPAEDQDLANYLAKLFKQNCIVDAKLTQALRAQRTDGLLAVVHYGPGQVIVRRGEVIDAKIKAALDQLKEKAVVGQLEALQAKQQATVGQLQQIVAKDQEKGVQAQEHVRWLIGLLGVIVFILAVAIWQLSRRKPTLALAPVANAGALEWQQRALVAEQRTEKLQTAARSGLLAHLSHWLSRMLTQRLISQRRLLLDTQSNAATEMAELEARLEKVQAPLQDRLTAYEKRIGELEKELEIRGEENRELLRAKIEMMRRQLEMEREKNRLEFN